MKICQVIFSTNRPEYLERTLASQHYLDFSGFEVEKIFIDDFPLGRDGVALAEMVGSFGYHEMYFHSDNKGIGATWEEFWAIVRERDYDYIWHQEDDVEILSPVRVESLVKILQRPGLSQVVLKRQPWYRHETDSVPLPTDLEIDDFRCEFNAAAFYFTPIASLYPASRAHVDYRGWFAEHYPDYLNLHTANINEGLIGKVLLEGHDLRSLHVKDQHGKNLIRHIGDYTVGRKLLIGEPGYDGFAGFNPEVKYWSATGLPYGV